jgi:hypothetical protein
VTPPQAAPPPPAPPPLAPALDRWMRALADAGFDIGLSDRLRLQAV